MIIEAIRTVWELPWPGRSGVFVLTVLCGAAAWAVVALGLRRLAREAPWWAVDLAGTAAGLGAGFGVLLAFAAPGPPIGATLLAHEGELRLLTVHEASSGLRRRRMRTLPEGTLLWTERIEDGAAPMNDDWLSGGWEQAVSCHAQRWAGPVLETTGCDAPETTLLAGVAREPDVRGLGQDGRELWRLAPEVVQGAQTIGMVWCGAQLCLIGGSARGLVVVAVAPDSGEVGWRVSR